MPPHVPSGAVSASELQEGVVRGAAESIRPFVERLLDLGVPFGRLERRLREVFVDAAERSLERSGDSATDSRVAALTGLNRKEIRRLRHPSDLSEGPKTFGRDLAANLLRVWTEDREACDRRGRPRALPFRSKTGASFVRLARRVTGELRPKAILEELLRRGALERLDDGRLLPRSQSYLPPRASPEALALLAEDPAELAGTMMRNVFGPGDPLFQRRVYFDDVGAEALDSLRREIRREGERIVRRMTGVLGRYDRDANPNAPGGERRYVSFGLYHFESDDPRKTGGGAGRRRSRRRSTRRTSRNGGKR